MKVLLVNTSERVGGAAIAANRLMEALKKHGVKVQMLVRDRQTQQMSVVSVRQSLWLPLKFLWERAVIFLNNGFRRSTLWSVDIANTGIDITQMPEFQRADVIHLHWVNQSFLSLSDLERILKSGKRIVITMHDMWYFTGICHYAADCQKYETQCTDCPLMSQQGIDYARRVFDRKMLMYAHHDITFVGCSQWIADMASRSALTHGHRVVSIPNAVNADVFCPVSDRMEARRSLGLPEGKRLILFSSQRITDERKGFSLLAESCRILKQQQPSLDLGIVVVGGDSETVRHAVPYEVFPISYVKKELDMAQLYNSVDAYVTSSLQDNLPNTIVEALACGTPCVGFRVGGIPEMIDHELNGYVARYRDAEDFARGILFCIDPQRNAQLAAAAREKAVATYGEEHVAQLYCEVYGAHN
ncbi:MAG: glycosyltransferase [Bacteroidaceae bacterium]|nr:glycosyltransferase [Bacteroidaceae bacterium]